MAGEVPQYNFDVDESDQAKFREFIEELRQNLQHDASSDGVPILCPDSSVGTQPNEFFDVVLETNSHNVTFRFRMDNLYLIGYRMSNGQWMEFEIPQNARVRVQDQVHLIHGSNFLPYTGEYTDLTRPSTGNRLLEDTPVGYEQLRSAVNVLAVADNERHGLRARSLVTVAIMISEAVRFVPVLEFIDAHYWPAQNVNDNILGVDLVRLMHSWGSLSVRVLRAAHEPNYTFEMPQPNDIGITTLKGAVLVLGMLKNYCIQRRFPRDVSFADGVQHAFGQMFAEVFSVRIDNIDGEDPGELYGTISVTDGLGSQCLYNRKSNEYESVKPMETFTLTGPSRCISAYDNFTINLDLKDYDTFPRDDEVSRGQMTWNVYDFTNEYNVLLSERIAGKYGAATVNYAVFRNAVQATVEVTLIDGDGENPANVYGSLVAKNNLLQQEIRLFRISKSGTSINVRPGEQIPLSRSTVVVPLQSSLTVEADLYDHDFLPSDDSIAKGSVNFPPKLSGTSTEHISGNYGRIEVKVTWYNN